MNTMAVTTTIKMKRVVPTKMEMVAVVMMAMKRKMTPPMASLIVTSLMTPSQVVINRTKKKPNRITNKRLKTNNDTPINQVTTNQYLNING